MLKLKPRTRVREGTMSDFVRFSASSFARESRNEFNIRQRPPGNGRPR